MWDNDIFSPDDYLGNCDIVLNRIEKPHRKAKHCKLVEHTEEDRKKLQYVNLFKAKRLKGWFPCKYFDKKANVWKLGGKIEAEFELLTAEEAEGKPAGKGRSEPNVNPTLNKPK